MPVAIKKCKFYTVKTEFCRFIIKLKKTQYRPKESRGNSQLVKTK